MKLGSGPGRQRELIEREFASCASLQQAAQRFTESFYEAFAESTVLVRVFATLRMEQLTATQQEIVTGFVERLGGSERLDDATDVLTLLGTFGLQDQWRERDGSRDHRAIPLLSDAFVAEIPMIARLLSEIGFPGLRRRSAAWQFVDRDAGLFFVGDARTATDERGRRIIPAVEFVERYGVKTVFGFGASAGAEPVFLTVIVFSRDILVREQAEPYATLFAAFRSLPSGIPIE